MKVLLFSQLSHRTLNSLSSLVSEYLLELFTIRGNVGVISIENDRGLQVPDQVPESVLSFISLLLDNIGLVDGYSYLSRDPMDELILMQDKMEYNVYNDALFVPEVISLGGGREERKEKGWSTLRCAKLPSKLNEEERDSLMKFFHEYVDTEEIITLKLGYAVRSKTGEHFPDLDHDYQDWVRST